MSTIFARPTLYRDVLMRSRLEAGWAEQFDALGWSWEYEPVCLAGPEGQYLPDFVVRAPHRGVAPIVFEVKGGWWEEPASYGLADDDDGWASVYERTFAERKRWSTLVAEWDARAMFVIGRQIPAWDHWPSGHVLEVWRPGQGSSMSYFSAHICTCPDGCSSLVAFARTECDHGHPWQDLHLVESLHGQWRGPRLDGPLYDRLAHL